MARQDRAPRILSHVHWQEHENMAFFLNLFSPQTYTSFSATAKDITGFKDSHARAAGKLKPGDVFVCYLTKLSRWVGLLEVIEGPFHDETPLFLERDPFTTRFRVKPLVWLTPEHAFPIHHPDLWHSLSFTTGHQPGSTTWTGAVRSSLRELSARDGALLEHALRAQHRDPQEFALSGADSKNMSTYLVRRPEGAITVSVPEQEEDEGVSPEAVRESYQIQALLAEAGTRMGHTIWLPMQDRGAVTSVWAPSKGELVDRLPFNYDETTLRTIERIDVLWLRGRSIVRAFEVEHTTAIYSGILRMADLLALQPNMAIKLHIVAPQQRRERVFEQLTRPVFSLLERGPLADLCSYLSYEAVRTIHSLKHLEHLQDTVVEAYEERVEP